MANLEMKLNQYVADLTVFYTKLHNLHWYVKGQKFFEFHALFEKYYDQVTADMDEVAERMLQLDMKPVASLKGVLGIAKIEEREDAYEDYMPMIKMVKADFEYLLQLTKETREAAEEAGDEPTVDLMVGFTAYYEKALWMMRATLS